MLAVWAKSGFDPFVDVNVNMVVCTINFCRYEQMCAVVDCDSSGKKHYDEIMNHI